MRAECAHLFPTLHLVTPNWLLEIGHRESIYTIETGTH